MNYREEYCFNVQKFLDLADNVEDEELKSDIKNSFFSAINSLCKVAKIDYDSLMKDGKNFRD